MMRFNRRGEWNIPFCKKPERFSKAYITKIVNQVRAARSIIQPKWQFRSVSFEETISEAREEDIIYCDPPYMGRSVDYFGGWKESEEHKLFQMLSSTEARFILSTWHHNEYRENQLIAQYWSQFNMVTREHFYHAGAKLHNRRSIVEALIFNFDAGDTDADHDMRSQPTQLALPGHIQ